jgi:hypothetical protein
MQWFANARCRKSTEFQSLCEKARLPLARNGLSQAITSEVLSKLAILSR